MGSFFFYSAMAQQISKIARVQSCKRWIIVFCEQDSRLQGARIQSLDHYKELEQKIVWFAWAWRMK